MNTGTNGATLTFDYKGLTSENGFFAVEYSIGEGWVELQKTTLENNANNNNWNKGQSYQLPSNEQVNVRFTCDSGGLSKYYFCAIDEVGRELKKKKVAFANIICISIVYASK